MAMGYTDRTDKFSQLVETATDRARKDIALAEEARARNAAAAMMLPSQIAEKSLQGYMTGKEFAGNQAMNQQKMAIDQQRMAEMQRQAALAEEQQAMMQQEYKPGMSLAVAQKVIPLQMQEKSAENQALASQAAIKSASERLAFQREAMDLKHQLAEQKGIGGQGKPMSPTDLEKFGQGRDSINTLTALEQTLNESQDIMGPFAGRKASVNPWDTKGQIVNSQVKAAAQTIGRYIEGGVLRAEDIPKYEAMLPNIKDTPEVAKGKLQVVRDMLLRKNDADVAALKEQGYNVAGVPANRGGSTFVAPLKQQSGEAVAEPNKPRTVKQNGVTFTLQPDGTYK